jgi:hypothetical protein
VRRGWVVGCRLGCSIYSHNISQVLVKRIRDI